MEPTKNGTPHFGNNGAIDSMNTHDKNDKSSNQKNHEARKLPDKKFQLRNSLLTDLVEKNPHIQTIYHICVAVFIYWVFNTLVHDYITTGRFILATDLIATQTRKIHLVLLFWLLLILLTVVVFYLFKLWAIIRITMLPPKENYLRVWDTIGLIACLSYYILSFMLSSSMITNNRLTVMMSFVICFEQTRLLMKVHSFLRHSAEEVLKYKTHSDKELKLPKLSHFIYFLFVPTLLYRKEYPRTNTIRWKFVFKSLLEVVLTIFVICFIVRNLAIPPYKEFGKTKDKWKEIGLSALQNCIPGILLYLSGFYLILHSVQNFFAELLRFGDRLFYEDWWNCTGFLNFFRTWNILVSDWLYAYIYKDVYELLIPNKYAAKFTVFIMSAVVHEWIIYKSLGFFLPLLLMEMLISGGFALRKDPKNQAITILMWLGLMYGNGVNTTIYGLEYVIRSTLLTENNVNLNKLLPQIFLLGE